MIPVLICPFLNRPDLTLRMLDSIDVPVGRVVIVDNSPAHDIDLGRPGIEYIRPVVGLGYPGGLNAGLSQTPTAAWWLFANNDLCFGPGDLAAIEGRMAGATGPRVVTGTRNDFRMLRWAYAGVNRETIARVGLLDEWAFYPIYFDDDDYERRCHLSGVEWIGYDGNIVHGTGDGGSMTIKSDAQLSERNRHTFLANRAAYIAKWGGLPGQELHAKPYGMEVPLSFVKPDPVARAQRLWESVREQVWETTALEPDESWETR